MYSQFSLQYCINDISTSVDGQRYKPVSIETKMDYNKRQKLTCMSFNYQVTYVTAITVASSKIYSGDRGDSGDSGGKGYSGDRCDSTCVNNNYDKEYSQSQFKHSTQ